MGQYWMLINLDKRIASGRSAMFTKLGEIWMNGTKADFVERLIVPPDQPSSDDSSSSMLGEWAGDRLMLVGDYADDYPPGVLNDREEIRVAAYRSGGLYKFAQNRFADSQHFYYQDELEKFFPGGNSWVLRNLSKRLFVLLDEVDEDECGTLEHVMLCYISWSSDPSSALTQDITRGEWVGDRFDIVIVERLSEGDLNDTPWKDVTDEVTTRAKRVAESEGRRRAIGF
ncbi:hypothetical protein BDN72DRAFT_847324 [Pluteus cervinus]|uniref:Uncharacterized protein n=1 Tax=Pluteus cervinus TaxID=181527 RepID=A0ACD3AEF6_9AGAR|nr:hypothetical protein BDN72DRAFT_847324 [Pluteus cervinus]